ncbi:dihydrofolate reductase [Streptococcus fryi]
MTKKIIAIWAEDEEGLIGKDGRLPWHLPKELNHFKETTSGHALLMGRVTFDGMNRRTLPNRETLILSSDAKLRSELNVTVFSNIKDVLSWYEQQEKSLFVVGGARVYTSLEPYFDDIIQTKVHGRFEGDTYFPDFDWSDYELVKETFFSKDEKNDYDFTVTHFTRKRSKEGN